MARHSKNGKRFFTGLDMAMLKRQLQAWNAMVKRGDVEDGSTHHAYDCGCGSEGCLLTPRTSPPKPVKYKDLPEPKRKGSRHDEKGQKAEWEN